MKTLTDLQQEAFQKFRDAIAILDKTQGDLIALQQAAPETATVWIDTGDLNFSFSGTGADLTKFVRELRKRKYRTDTRPSKKDSSYSAHFVRAEDGARVYVAFSSTVCRVRQVGTKMVETPIYETVCE